MRTLVLSPFAGITRRSLLDDFLGSGPTAGEEVVPGCMDLHETDEAFVLQVDVPGFQKADINIDVNAERITIEGERKASAEGRPLFNERPAGTFRRTLALPRRVNASAVEATLDLGVLTIRLPKQAAEIRQKVEIR